MFFFFRQLFFYYRFLITLEDRDGEGAARLGLTDDGETLVVGVGVDLNLAVGEEADEVVDADAAMPHDVALDDGSKLLLVNRVKRRVLFELVAAAEESAGALVREELAREVGGVGDGHGRVAREVLEELK